MNGRHVLSSLAAVFLFWAFPHASTHADESPRLFYERPPFTVVYRVAGDDAVPRDDGNGNGVPDRIEDIAAQLEAARDLFHNLYRFPDPLDSRRYAEKRPEIVDVIVRGRASIGGNGLAFSESTRSASRPEAFSLKLHISASLDPRKNVTPAHEYFHLIQYGATYFRNGWFLEGMARWSEDGLGRKPDACRKSDLAGLLQDKGRVERLFGESYGAADTLWNPLALSCGDKKHIPLAMQNKHRYVDGSPVFRDNLFNGPETMQSVLLCLPGKEDGAAKVFGDQKAWPRQGQRSETNNLLILQCVREVWKQCGGR